MIAVLVIVSGVLDFILGVLPLFGKGADTLLFGGSITTLMLAIILMIGGLGIWLLQKWAWLIGVIALVMRLIVDLLLIFAGGNLLATLFIIILVAVLLWYLVRPKHNRRSSNYRNSDKWLFVGKAVLTVSPQTAFPY